MAKATSKVTSLTTLVIGQVEVPVGLFSTVAKAGKVAEFDTAGPNGGVLKARPIARPVPVAEQLDERPDEPVHSDPFADDPSAETYGEAAARLTEEVRAEMVGKLQAEPEGGLAERLAAPAGVPDPMGPGPGMERDTWSGDPTAVAADAMAADFAQVDGEYGRELVEEGSDVVVLPQDVRRGVRLEDGRFIDCTDRLAEIDRDTKLERMEVVGFVDVTRVHRARVKGSYYIGTDDAQAPRVLRIMFEAMKLKRRGAVVKLTKRSRQSLGVIGWLGDALVLYELVFAEDFREPPARALRLQRASVSQAEVEQFSRLIGAMSITPDVLDDLRDDAIAKREELKAKALAGEVPDVIAAPPNERVDDVMAQLEASLAAVGS